MRDIFEKGIYMELNPLAAVPPDISDVLIMNVPVYNHGIAGVMEFEIAILVNGSLKSAGHRATLFSRLLDEHETVRH